MAQLRNDEPESIHPQPGLKVLGAGSVTCLPEEQYFPAADLLPPLRINIWKG